MAVRPSKINISQRPFTQDPELRKYILEGVKFTGKELGRGSYGSVIEVTYQQRICAAKQLHELLLQPGNQGVPEFMSKYLRECQLMASVSHPNLTQFLGLCFLGEANSPLLVMERLEMSFDELLTGALNMSLLLKLSLLHDMCNGLVYLHSRQPLIVHRDLTARNVLISSSMTAKIADFGCSRIVDIRFGQLAQTMSKAPGTLVYMPPEALDNTHKYGPSLDVFSFGHLTLYTIIQEFPGNLLSSTHPDPNNSDRIIARSEVERRQPYMATLETQVAQSHPVLLELVRQCLHNAPNRRPSSGEIRKILKEVKEEMEGRVGDNFKQKDVGENQLIQNLQGQLKVTYPLQLHWRRGPDMPIAMSGYIQSVSVEETLYVGGGLTDKKEDKYIVMTFNIQTTKWDTLLPYSARNFAMTTINNKLVLVGGNHNGAVNQLGVWQTELKEWTYPLPPMASARALPSATSYKHWLIVAGGHDGNKFLSTVEVLDVDNKQWSTRPSTPTPWYRMKSTMIGDTWYLMGGRHNKSFIPDVYSVSLEALESHSTSDKSSIWKQLASLNCTSSSPLHIEGSLLAFGGYDEEKKKNVSSILHYIPQTNTWVQAGTIPRNYQNVTCIMTADQVYMIGGYDGKENSASTYFHTF